MSDRIELLGSRISEPVENKFQREVELLRDGVVTGATKRLEDMGADLLGTATTLGLCGIAGAGLSAASRAGGRWGVAAKIAGYGLGGLLTLDVANRSMSTADAMIDTWSSPLNLESNKRMIADSLGTAVIDYPVMMLSGYAGFKVGARLTPRPLALAEFSPSRAMHEATTSVPNQTWNIGKIESSSGRLACLLNMTGLASGGSLLANSFEKKLHQKEFPKGSLEIAPLFDLGRSLGPPAIHLPGGRLSYITKDGAQILDDSFEWKLTELTLKNGNTEITFYDGLNFTPAKSVQRRSEGGLTVTFPEPHNRPAGAKQASSLTIEPRNAVAEFRFPDGTNENRYWDGESYRHAEVKDNADGSRTFIYDHVGHQSTGVLNPDRTTLTLTGRAGEQVVCRWSAQFNRFLCPEQQ